MNFKVYEAELNKLLTKPYKFPLPEWQPTSGKEDYDCTKHQNIKVIDLRMNDNISAQALTHWCTQLTTVFVIPGDFRGMLIRRDHPHITVYNIPDYVFIPRAKPSV